MFSYFRDIRNVRSDSRIHRNLSQEEPATNLQWASKVENSSISPSPRAPNIEPNFVRMSNIPTISAGVQPISSPSSTVIPDANTGAIGNETLIDENSFPSPSRTASTTVIDLPIAKTVSTDPNLIDEESLEENGELKQPNVVDKQPLDGSNSTVGKPNVIDKDPADGVDDLNGPNVIPEPLGTNGTIGDPNLIDKKPLDESITPGDPNLIEKLPDKLRDPNIVDVNNASTDGNLRDPNSVQIPSSAPSSGIIIIPGKNIPSPSASKAPKAIEVQSLPPQNASSSPSSGAQMRDPNLIDFAQLSPSASAKLQDPNMVDLVWYRSLPIRLKIPT